MHARAKPRATELAEHPGREQAAQQVAAKVHAGRDRLDALLDFLSFAARPMPLTTFLDEAPRRLARIIRSDVASLYLLEGGGGELVMRGNVGFPERALGQVRLAVGEGITGTVIECLRPISTQVARDHTDYRDFPELGEERFPVFVAVPIFGPSGPLGAVTLQRRGQTPFSDADVELLVTLGASIGAALRHADLLDALRGRSSPGQALGSGSRKLTLAGRPLLAGRSLGVLAALRRPSGRTRPVYTQEHRYQRLSTAFTLAERAINALGRRCQALGLDEDGAFLTTYVQAVKDDRLRQRAFDLLKQDKGIAAALGQVARETVKAATGLSGDPYLEQRARDIEDLCDAVVMLAAGDPQAALPRHAIVMGDQVTVFDAIVSARFKPAGIVLTDRAQGPRTPVLLQLMGVPALGNVVGLFRWAADGDVALLDADHGILVINPSRADISAFRKGQRPE